MSEPHDWRALYPFPSQELRIDGLRYHYLDQGQGPTLLLVHGNPTWSFYWRRLVLALQDRCRLIVPDHMGCGLSDKPQQYPYRLAQHVDNLTHLVESLDLHDVTLVGHDWGGAIGMGTAARCPERFRQFVLMNTGAFRSQQIPLRIRVCRTPGLGKLAVRGLNGFVEAALRMATRRRELFTPQVRAGYRAPYDSWANRIATHEFVRDIPLRPGHPSYPALCDVEAGLSQFQRHRMMLLWGMRDWCFTPRFLERFIEFFPQAEVHRFPDAGHWVMEDAYAEVISHIRRFVLATEEISSPDPQRLQNP